MRDDGKEEKDDEMSLEDGSLVGWSHVAVGRHGWSSLDFYDPFLELAFVEDVESTRNNHALRTPCVSSMWRSTMRMQCRRRTVGTAHEEVVSR